MSTKEVPLARGPQEDSAARLQRLADRTRAFFRQDIEILAEDLMSRQIIDQTSGARIVVTGTKAYSSQENITGDKKYKAMAKMDPGDYYAVDWPFRNTVLSLIVGQDEGGIGACVQITSASSPDATSGEFKKIKRQGDIARTLNLGINGSEKGILAFIDDSQDLYLIGREDVEISDNPNSVDSSNAWQVLNSFVDKS